MPVNKGPRLQPRRYLYHQALFQLTLIAYQKCPRSLFVAKDSHSAAVYTVEIAMRPPQRQDAFGNKITRQPHWIPHCLGRIHRSRKLVGQVRSSRELLPSAPRCTGRWLQQQALQPSSQLGLGARRLADVTSGPAIPKLPRFDAAAAHLETMPMF